MKRLLFVAFALPLAAAAGLSAAGSREAASTNDVFRGTWYGGSSNSNNAGYKYQYTFIPTGADRWYVTADGAYNPDTLGVAVATTWTGEAVKAGEAYDIRGKITAMPDGGLTINYDYWGKYAWGTVPFVDQPTTWMLKPGSTPVTDTIHRMAMDVPLPQ